MHQFDFETSRATPEWLTSVLEKNGFLSSGEVSSIEQEITLTQSAIISSFFSLKVDYSQESEGYLPANILMKLNQADFYGMGQKEIDFYEAISNIKTPLPLVTCYGTETSVETKQCYILLDDLTESHRPPKTQWPSPPPLEQCKAAIAALAKMQAYWWNHDSLTKSNFELPEDWGTNWNRRAEKLFPPFVDFLGDRLSEKTKKTYEVIFEKLAELMLNRLSSSKRLTLLHGDAHYWNFLYPRHQEEGQCIIIDWQLCKIGLGAFDLSYMIALHCYPEYRQKMEQPLLTFYLEEMQKQHIDYNRVDFWTDYRVSVIFNLLYPILLQAKGVPEFIWYPHLERGLAAFEDLNCLELL